MVLVVFPETKEYDPADRALHPPGRLVMRQELQFRRVVREGGGDASPSSLVVVVTADRGWFGLLRRAGSRSACGRRQSCRRSSRYLRCTPRRPGANPARLNELGTSPSGERKSPVRRPLPPRCSATLP